MALRLKNREVDLVVVVNMFLTGFDATTLNTLWVDKNLRQHGLIQAFSRTNRILNSVKTYGNIVSFRNLEDEMNEALALFGNKDAKGIVLLKPYAEYVSEYEAKVAELLSEFPVGSVSHIVGEERQKQFIKLFGSLLRLLNILVSFDDFAGQQILSDRDLQDYRSAYLDLYADFRQQAQADKESINDDVVFEIELVKQVEVNVDYILMLVKKYIEEGRGQDREIRAEIARAIDSSPSLRNKKDLIEEFIDQITLGNDIDENWRGYIAQRRTRELEEIIAAENLNSEATWRFVEQAVREGSVQEGGTIITEVLPPTSRFKADGALTVKKRSVIERLSAFLDRYEGLTNS